MMSSEVRRPTSSHLLLPLTSGMSLRWSHCLQLTLGRLGNLPSYPLVDLQLQEILTYHPKVDSCVQVLLPRESRRKAGTPSKPNKNTSSLH